MRNFIETLIVVFITFSIISCQSKKDISGHKSEFFTDSIYSNNLAEYRRHNIYLPKGFDTDKKYPIFYSTDGNEITKDNFYKKTLDSLIDNEVIKPLIFIESHSNSKIADSTSQTRRDGSKVYLQYRNFEYINDMANSSNDSILVNRFENHMLYFHNELISSVEKIYNQNPNKDDRYFYGFSNGAGFGLSLLNSYPNTIGTYLCFSTFGDAVQSYSWKENVDYPKLYLLYGSEEPSFLKKEAEFLKRKYEELNLFAQIDEYEGGHDYKIWNEKFIEIISKILAVE